MCVFVVAGVEDYLCEPVSVAKVYKDDATVVSSRMYPTAERNFFFFVFSCEFAARVCSEHGVRGDEEFRI